MSDKYAALKQAAELATPGPWKMATDWERAAVFSLSKEAFPEYKRVVCSGNQNNHKRWNTENWSGADWIDAEFIAAANPVTILELLAERDADKARIAELEKGHAEADKQITSWRRIAKKNIAEREADSAVLTEARQRIAELEASEIKPAQGEVLVTVTGYTGSGKSAIAGEIEIAMKAIGVPVEWTNGNAEKRMTGADWLTAIEMYKPNVRIVEVNVPRAAGISLKIEGE